MIAYCSKHEVLFDSLPGEVGCHACEAERVHAAAKKAALELKIRGVRWEESS